MENSINKELEQQQADLRTKQASLTFVDRLRQEILHHKEKRTMFVLQKLAFITILFGIGFLDIPNCKFYGLFYLIPFVAIVYDAYISAEEYKVKRACHFLRTYPNYLSPCEGDWESYIDKKREWWDDNASLTLTSLSLIIASLALIYNYGFSLAFVLVVIWAGVSGALIRFVYQHYQHLVQNLEDKTLPNPLKKLV